MTWRESGKNTPELDEALNLKICDLCGALNLVADPECVMCRWHGHFERRPEVIRIALEFHAQRHLASDIGAYANDYCLPEDRYGGFLARLREWWNALRRRVIHPRF